MPLQNKLPRDKDPNYIYNTKTRRWIKKTGKTYQQLLLDQVAGLNSDDRKHAMLAEGTPEELKILHSKLKDNTQVVGAGKELVIKHNKLLAIRKKVHKGAVRDKIRSAQSAVAVENRELFKSDLTDQQITFLLGKICDMKLMGKTIDVKAEVNQLLGISAELKQPTLTRKPRRPFKVLPPPPTDTENQSDSSTDSII